MKITTEWNSYNPRRYSKPWVSRVVSWAGEEPTIEWGAYVGDASGGMTSIEAQPGDIVRMDQRDDRATRRIPAPWYIVQDDGTLKQVTKLEAYKWFTNREVPKPKVPVDKSCRECGVKHAAIHCSNGYWACHEHAEAVRALPYKKPA